MHNKIEIQENQNCSINRDFNNDSCFTLEELHQIAKYYNDSHPNDTIKLHTNNKMYLQFSSRICK